MIFGSFNQADGSYTKQHGGAGLGLSIAQQIVLCSEEVLALKAVPDRGVRFLLRQLCIEEEGNEDTDR